MTRSHWMMTFCLIAAAPLTTNAQEKLRQKPLIPLALGNQWTYVEKMYDLKGTVREVKPYVVAIRGVFDLDFGRVYCSNDGEFTTWIRNTPQGNEEILVRQNPDSELLEKTEDKPVLFFPYPAKVGQKHDLQYDPKEPPPEWVVVAAENVKVTTPAGTFPCLRYEFWFHETKQINHVVYICPGIGQIREEFFLEGKLASTYELKAVKLADKNE